MKINPALHHHWAEAKHIGHMILSYGEIEIAVAKCLGLALGNQDTAYKTMFRVIGESARIGAADALMREAYQKAALDPEYSDMIGAVRFCVRIRNQFAHCMWGEQDNSGLYFTTLAEPASTAEGFELWWLHLDVSLVRKQEEHFDYTMDWLSYLEAEYQVRTGKIKVHPFPRPPKLPQPSLHNPPDEHIPPWLTEDQQHRHLERALKSKEDVHSPSAPQKSPRKKKPSAAQRRAAKKGAAN